MEKSFSNRVININAILTLFVVLLHASCLRFIKTDGVLIPTFYKTIEIVGDSAVPLFFLISSFMLYRTFSFETIGLKFSSRIKSLLIPYLFWSVVFYVYYFVISRIPSIASSFDGGFDFSLEHFIFAIIFADCAEGMWFVRVLMTFCVISPFVYFVANKLRHYFVIIPVLLFVFNIVFLQEYSSFIFWLPIHLIGCYLALYFRPTIERENETKWWIGLLAFALYVSMVVCCEFVNQYSRFYYCFRILSAIPLYLVFSSIPFISHKPKIQYCSFFVYCTHLPLLKVVRKSLMIVFGTGAEISLLIYFLTVVLTLVIVNLVSLLIRKVAPRFYSLITGCR